MKIKSINRNYGIHNLKLWIEFKFDREYYDNLCNNKKWETMKEYYIRFSEDRLHVIASHLFLIKFVFPIIIGLVLILSIHTNEQNLSIFTVIGFIITTIYYFTFKKLWKQRCYLYTLEITAIDKFLTEKHNINIDTDFDIVGERYLNGEL